LSLPAPRGEVGRRSRVGGVSSEITLRDKFARHPSVSLCSTPPRGAQGGARIGPVRFEASGDMGEPGGLFQEFEEADDVICIEIAVGVEVNR